VALCWCVAGRMAPQWVAADGGKGESYNKMGQSMREIALGTRHHAASITLP